MAKTKKEPKRRLLTDHQCRVFHRSLREDFPSVTFDKVVEISKQVAAGTFSRTDVIAVLMVANIDEADGDPK